MMSGALLSASIGAALAFEDATPSSAIVDGHTLRVESVSTVVTQPAQEGRLASKTASITFAVDPKDVAKSFAYEIGQRFVARDAAGKEIAVGQVHGQSSREPSFRLAGYPQPPTDGPFSSFRGSLKVALPLLDAGVKSIATLEGDVFVSDVELFEFTFTKDELDPNITKKFNGAEAKLFLYDEVERGVEIGFKIALPVRSRARALTGEGLSNDHFLLFATQEGRKVSLAPHGSSGGGNGYNFGEPRYRTVREFSLGRMDRKPDALHLVIPQIEYPRRHVFRIKDVPIPPPMPIQRPQVPGRPIAAR